MTFLRCQSSDKISQTKMPPSDSQKRHYCGLQRRRSRSSSFGTLFSSSSSLVSSMVSTALTSSLKSTGCMIAMIVLALFSGSLLMTMVEASSRSQTTSNTNAQLSTLPLNYLLFSSQNNNQTTTLLKSALNNSHQNLETLLKDSEHNHASDKVDLQVANLVWRKMHQNALDYAQERIKQARPTLDRFMSNSNISSSCSKSLNDIIDHIGNLEQWAVQMYNAFGEFPAVGFFEGTLTSMGSYHQCVGLEPNEWIERPQFCTYKFQPIIPKRPRYHNMLASIENLANFTNKDDVSLPPLSNFTPLTYVAAVH